MDPLVVERIGRLAVQLLPLLAQVEVPVVFAHHDLQRGLEVLEDLGPQLKLFDLSELGQVAAVEDEVGLRIEVVHVVDRAEQPAHEPIVHLALVQVRVGDVGEAKVRLRLRDSRRPAPR